MGRAPPALLLGCALVSFPSSPRVSNAKVIRAAVIPHGGFCYDPSLVQNSNGSLELHRAADAVGARIAEDKPD